MGGRWRKKKSGLNRHTLAAERWLPSFPRKVMFPGIRNRKEASGMVLTMDRSMGGKRRDQFRKKS